MGDKEKPKKKTTKQQQHTLCPACLADSAGVASGNLAAELALGEEGGVGVRVPVF